MKLIRFKVKGSFRFPLDMLRYDACWPASPGDTGNMEASFDARSPTGYEVELIHWAANAGWQPTVDRWASFGWYVVTGSVRE
jgi:hypothetical protein